MKAVTFSRLEHYGRLGNQLFQVCAVAAHAKKHDATPFIRSDWAYRPFFRLPEEWYDPIPVDADLTDLEGYFQEYPIFEEFIDEVNDWFTPSVEEMNVLAPMGLETPLTDSKPVASLHIRRGDYVKHADLFPFPGDKYYGDAIDDIKSRHGDDTSFIVFSDDFQWSKDFLSKFDAKFFLVKGVATPVEVRKRKNAPQDQHDLFLQSFCDEHIIANSSFSYWGAMLAKNDKVIYPERWWGPAVPEIADLHKMFPSTWRKFEC